MYLKFRFHNIKSLPCVLIMYSMVGIDAFLCSGTLYLGWTHLLAP